MSKSHKKAKLKLYSKKFNVYEVIYIQKRNHNKKAIYKKGNLIGSWYNNSICAKDLKLNRHSVGDCLRGKQKIHKNYIFEYVNEQ